MILKLKYCILFFSLLIYNNEKAQETFETLKPIIEGYLNTNLDSAKKYSELLIKSAYEHNNKLEEHHAFNYLAHIAYREGNKFEALENFMNSLQLRYTYGKITETANTLNWIGRIHHEN